MKLLLMSLVLCIGLTGATAHRAAAAADTDLFELNIRFHIKTERTSFAATVDFLRDSIAAAERLYVQAPALKINPTFVQAAHRRIETRRDADGKPFTYIGFENSQDLVRFMDENFDHYARTRTDGHMTVLVVDQAVQNEDKGKGLCGRAAFPHAVSLFSRKVGMLLVPCDVNRDGQLDVFILAHELGHYFSLLHTFGRYVDITPQSPGNCNKAFGNHAKCNSCQGTIQTKNGEPRLCDGTSNVMDYCTSATGVEVLNACQLNRASDQMKRYQTRDGQTDYVALAGVRGTPACAADTDCASGEYCNAGFPGVARARCVSLNQHGALCTNDRQCATGRCAWGRCADADECRADGDCGSAQYCGDPVSGKRTCKALHADNEACALAGGDKQCASGHCQSGRCFTPQSVALNGTCYVNDACSQGKCSSVNGTRGTCVCDRDGDCGSGYWCNAGLDVNLNRCERKLDKGEVCGKIGELGVGHRCKSGSCKASFGVNLKCT